MIKYRAHNGYDAKKASDEAVGPEPGISLTIQSMAEEADINVLMYRYGITGKMPDNPRIPTYGDFTGITDYRTAIEAVRDAEHAFMEIPAQVRSKFDNDPQKFLEFCSMETNVDEMRKLGLLKPTQAPPPTREPTTTNPDTPKAT